MINAVWVIMPTSQAIVNSWTYAHDQSIFHYKSKVYEQLLKALSGAENVLSTVKHNYGRFHLRLLEFFYLSDGALQMRYSFRNFWIWPVTFSLNNFAWILNFNISCRLNLFFSIQELIVRHLFRSRLLKPLKTSNSAEKVSFNPDLIASRNIYSKIRK